MTEAKIEERACEYCGRTDTMVGKRSDAKFCDVTCRKMYFRRQRGVRERFRMHNSIRTDTLEYQIALAMTRNVTAEKALRGLADKIGAPIREERIKEEVENIRRIDRRDISVTSQ